jgi:hypothetical protein
LEQPTRPHRISLERAMRDAGHTLPVAVAGWPLTVHFAALGVGPAVVTGCLQPPPGLVAIPITELPKIIFHPVHRPGALDDPRTAALLKAIRAIRRTAAPA